jgi:hypothetical protein
MSATEFQAVADFQKQTVGESFMMFENNAPGYNSFKKFSERKHLTDKGFRIPGWHERPGGHTSWTYSSPDFNAAKGPKSKSMYVFPVGYALPMQNEGSLIRAFKEGNNPDALMNWRDYYLTYTEAATKRIEHFFFGDSSGALAFSASTLGATGAGQTLNCSTTAAATAGQTKGARRLEPNQWYQAINASTGAVRGTFQVTTPGGSSCVINLTSGTITSGDPIVDVGGYQKAMRGLAWLISDQNRTLQGLNTADFPDLNSPFVDLNGALMTPATIHSLKASLNVRNNDKNASKGLKWFITPGQYANLCSQGYGLRRYMGAAPVEGVSDEYKEGDWEEIQAADLDEDRSYAAKAEKMKEFEEKPFGPYDLDGMDMRMLLGANGTGSDVYQRAIGLRGNPGITGTRACAGIKRAMISGVTTQVSAG